MEDKKTRRTKKTATTAEEAVKPVTPAKPVPKLDEAAIADRVAREIYREISDRMRMNGGLYGSLVSIYIVYEACKRHMVKGR